MLTPTSRGTILSDTNVIKQIRRAALCSIVIIVNFRHLYIYLIVIYLYEYGEDIFDSTGSFYVDLYRSKYVVIQNLIIYT